jgi:hypothetical protein
MPKLKQVSSAIKCREEYKNKRQLTDSEGEEDEQLHLPGFEMSDFEADYINKTGQVEKFKTTPFGFMDEVDEEDRK